MSEYKWCLYRHDTDYHFRLPEKIFVDWYDANKYWTENELDDNEYYFQETHIQDLIL